MDNEPTLSIYENGTKSWKLNGLSHREDGPAFEYGNNIKWWYLNGTRYDFDVWLEVNKYISEEEKVMLKLTYG
jgi:hypothetical protein